MCCLQSFSIRNCFNLSVINQFPPCLTSHSCFILVQQSLLSVMSLILTMWTALVPPTTPHSVNNPSGTRGPGKSQAQCVLAGLLPRGCGATVSSRSRPTSKLLIQTSPRLPTADSSDWQKRCKMNLWDRHTDINVAFCLCFVLLLFCFRRLLNNTHVYLLLFP